jgi:cysteine desulfurase
MAKNITYLDNASTTPVSKEVFSAMAPYLKGEYGNPSSLHEKGRKAKEAIEESKKEIASIIHCRPSEFVITGSATEADNLALAGVARANKPARAGGEYGNKIIISSVEHKGVISICEVLEKEGFEIIKLPVDENGTVVLSELKKELNEKTILVSITMADSETGTIQPTKEIGRIIKNFRIGKNYPYFHVDASQAAQYLDLNIEKLGVDMMTISAHKMGGPKGIGGLYVKKGIKINPVIFGGGQQGTVRSGTENVAGIVGFGCAMKLTEKIKQKEFVRVKKLRDKLEKEIFKTIPKVVLNGHSENRLPNFLNVSFLDIEGEALLLYLDNDGIMVSTGSACNSDSLEPSYILMAQGKPYEYIHGSIRFSLGKTTTDKDIKNVMKSLPKVVKLLRSVSPLDVNMKEKNEMTEPKAFVGGQRPHFLRKNDK